MHYAFFLLLYASWPRAEEAEGGGWTAAAGGNDPAAGAAAEPLQSAQGGWGE